MVMVMMTMGMVIMTMVKVMMTMGMVMVIPSYVNVIPTIPAMPPVLERSYALPAERGRRKASPSPPSRTGGREAPFRVLCKNVLGPFFRGIQIRRRPQDLILCYVGLEACPGLWRGASGVEGVEKDSVLEHMA